MLEPAFKPSTEVKLSKESTILGIDPGLNNVGWGIITGNVSKMHYLVSGVIKPPSADLIHKKLSFIVESLEKIILQYRPTRMAIEETFVNMNNASSLKLGFARGAIMALVGKYDIMLQEFKPNLIKKTLTGYGHADKQQILHMIKLLFPTAPSMKSMDEADGLAIAYTGLVHSATDHY